MPRVKPDKPEEVGSTGGILIQTEFAPKLIMLIERFVVFHSLIKNDILPTSRQISFKPKTNQSDMEVSNAKSKTG